MRNEKGRLGKYRQAELSLQKRDISIHSYYHQALRELDPI